MVYKNIYQEPTITYEQMNLKIKLRNLWRERATWTRAEFLASINPFWNEAVMKKLYYTYNQLTLEEIMT